MIYFISDTHFWHKHIIEYCRRPWESTEEMNAALIGRWNERIKPDDEVYFLGDFAFCGTTKATDIFGQLRGRKHLIRGNHDNSGVAKLGWESVRDYALIRPAIEYQKDDGEMAQHPQPVVLCHFPIMSWDGMAHGSWHLHGHCHGSLPDNGSLRLDMGVDCNNWYPVSLPELQAKLALRTVVPVDHHQLGMRANPA